MGFVFVALSVFVFDFFSVDLVAADFGDCTTTVGRGCVLCAAAGGAGGVSAAGVVGAAVFADGAGGEVCSAAGGDGAVVSAVDLSEGCPTAAELRKTVATAAAVATATLLCALSRFMPIAPPRAQAFDSILLSYRI